VPQLKIDSAEDFPPLGVSMPDRKGKGRAAYP
jgi:hypothetical protein